MTYSVKEIFYTIQGEGAQTGRPAVFCRFTGCNLWSGREEDRLDAVCGFCDTDFVGIDGTRGGKFRLAEDLAVVIDSQWPQSSAVQKFVVCTGGEPLLQLDDCLVQALHERGFKVAVETNGTQEAPENLDWICVSPKIGTELRLRKGNELKFIFPQLTHTPDSFQDLEFDHFFLVPMDGNNLVKNTQKALEYVMKNPQWKLSLQVHKLLGIS